MPAKGSFLHLLFLLTGVFFIFIGCNIVDSGGVSGLEVSKGDYEDYISLHWDSVLDASTYNVYYAESENGYYTLLESTIFNWYDYYFPLNDGYYYYFKVSYTDGEGNESEPGDPDFGYTAILSDEYESKDSNYQNVITAGQPVQRTLHSGADIDWFTFIPIEIKSFIVQTVYKDDSYTYHEKWVPADTALYLYEDTGTGSPGSLLASDEDSGSPSGYSMIQLQLTAGKKYFVKIAGDEKTDAPEGWYRLSVN